MSHYDRRYERGRADACVCDDAALDSVCRRLSKRFLATGALFLNAEHARIPTRSDERYHGMPGMGAMGTGLNPELGACDNNIRSRTTGRVRVMPRNVRGA